MNKDKLRLRQSIWQEVNPCLEEGRAQDKLGAQKEAREAQSTPSRPQADLQAAVAHGGAACAGEGPRTQCRHRERPRSDMYQNASSATARF